MCSRNRRASRQQQQQQACFGRGAIPPQPIKIEGPRPFDRSNRSKLMFGYQAVWSNAHGHVRTSITISLARPTSTPVIPVRRRAASCLRPPNERRCEARCAGGGSLARGRGLNCGVILRLEQSSAMESNQNRLGRPHRLRPSSVKYNTHGLLGWVWCVPVVALPGAPCGAAHVRPTGGDKHKEKQVNQKENHISIKSVGVGP